MNDEIKNPIKPADDRTPLTLEEWKAEGIKRFGDDHKQWKFKCVACNGHQTLQEFIDLGVDNPEQKHFFSCIGCWDKARGCDWTLGGLFQIHTVEVIADDGEVVPVFEFADV